MPEPGPRTCGLRASTRSISGHVLGLRRRLFGVHCLKPSTRRPSPLDTPSTRSTRPRLRGLLPSESPLPGMNHHRSIRPLGAPADRFLGSIEQPTVHSHSSDAASQYERAFTPQRLGNWELADSAKVVSRFEPTSARSGKSQPIVDAKGHLLPGHRKSGATSFAKAERKPCAASKPLWPEVRRRRAHPSLSAVQVSEAEPSSRHSRFPG